MSCLVLNAQARIHAAFTFHKKCLAKMGRENLSNQTEPRYQVVFLLEIHTMTTLSANDHKGTPFSLLDLSCSHE